MLRRDRTNAHAYARACTHTPPTVFSPTLQHHDQHENGDAKQPRVQLRLSRRSIARAHHHQQQHPLHNRHSIRTTRPHTHTTRRRRRTDHTFSAANSTAEELQLPTAPAPCSQQPPVAATQPLSSRSSRCTTALLSAVTRPTSTSAPGAHNTPSGVTTTHKRAFHEYLDKQPRGGNHGRHTAGDSRSGGGKKKIDTGTTTQLRGRYSAPLAVQASNTVCNNQVRRPHNDVNGLRDAVVEGDVVEDGHPEKYDRLQQVPLQRDRARCQPWNTALRTTGNSTVHFEQMAAVSAGRALQRKQNGTVTDGPK